MAKQQQQLTSNTPFEFRTDGELPPGQYTLIKAIRGSLAVAATLRAKSSKRDRDSTQ